MIRAAGTAGALFCALLGLLGAPGCSTPAFFYQSPPLPEMLGTKVDQIMELQVQNAEAAKFVVYQHEFEDRRYENGVAVKDLRLNEAGEDHVRKIAEQLRAGSPYPVVVERSQTSAKHRSQFGYPVHLNPDLDMKRREAIVRALTRMGIDDADTRVVVAPAFSQPLTGMEAESAYSTGLWGGGMGGGMGGGWGGGMGGGMGGGWQ